MDPDEDDDDDAERGHCDTDEDGDGDEIFNSGPDEASDSIDSYAEGLGNDDVPF